MSNDIFNRFTYVRYPKQNYIAKLKTATIKERGYLYFCLLAVKVLGKPVEKTDRKRNPRNGILNVHNIVCEGIITLNTPTGTVYTTRSIHSALSLILRLNFLGSNDQKQSVCKRSKM